MEIFNKVRIILLIVIMIFTINETCRDKKTYVGPWQLVYGFRNLDSSFDSTFETTYVLGHLLVHALKDFKPANYVKQYIKGSSMEEKLHYDELRTYFDMLKTVSSHLRKKFNSPEEIMSFLHNDVVAFVEQHQKDQSPLNSYILQTLVEETDLFDKNNPSDTLQTTGNNLYDLVNKSPPLSGQRAILEKNYDMIIKAIRL